MFGRFSRDKRFLRSRTPTARTSWSSFYGRMSWTGGMSDGAGPGNPKPRHSMYAIYMPTLTPQTTPMAYLAYMECLGNWRKRNGSGTLRVSRSSSTQEFGVGCLCRTEEGVQVPLSHPLIGLEAEHQSPQRLHVSPGSSTPFC